MLFAAALLILCTAESSLRREVPAGCAWVRAENEGAGAGFVIDTRKRLLITCRHVVAARSRVDVLFPWVRDGELVSSGAEYLRNRTRLRELGLLVVGRVLRTSDELDLALIQLESIPPGVKAVTFAARRPLPGDPLHVFGNRLDLETVWNATTGCVRASGRLADGYFWRGKKLCAGAGALIAQLPIEEGDSGGAVFDSHGEVVGIASALRRQCPLAAVCIDGLAIRSFAELPEPQMVAEHGPIDAAVVLARATVWIRPTATDTQLAGVLIEPDLVMTTGQDLVPGDRVGIAIPIWKGKSWIGERPAYRDPLALQQSGHWRGGRVLARDDPRGLTLIRLDSPLPGMRPLALSGRAARVGDAIHTMNHPGGLEFAWVYSAGTVRQRGRIAVVPGETARAVTVLVCQVPAQSGSPGGAIVNDAGQLVGILTAKESTQMVGYAVAADEIASFLEVAVPDRPARTVPGLVARITALPDQLAAGTARGLAQRAERHRREGRTEEADRDAAAAIALDPRCHLARLCRARLRLVANRLEEARTELDAAIEKGPFDRDLLAFRAELSAVAKEWRRARGDLQRVLDVDPGDAAARQRLAGVYLELGEDARAAAALRDTLRADPKRLQSVAADLLTQADTLERKFPDAPAIPADWLARALAGAGRDEFSRCLKRAENATDDAGRLASLRAGLAQIAER